MPYLSSPNGRHDRAGNSALRGDKTGCEELRTTRESERGEVRECAHLGAFEIRIRVYRVVNREGSCNESALRPNARPRATPDRVRAPRTNPTC